MCQAADYMPMKAKQYLDHLSGFGTYGQRNIAKVNQLRGQIEHFLSNKDTWQYFWKPDPMDLDPDGLRFKS